MILILPLLPWSRLSVTSKAERPVEVVGDHGTRIPRIYRNARHGDDQRVYAATSDGEEEASFMRYHREDENILKRRHIFVALLFPGMKASSGRSKRVIRG
jgi:hypothetical protein